MDSRKNEATVEQSKCLLDSTHPIYTPLDPSIFEIRLLTLCPGQRHDGIAVTLSKVSLHQQPEFEALSYVWGSNKDLRTIYVEGVEFNVTENLCSALIQLRYTDRPRKLWIDAICIDQMNVAERNEQVTSMHKVYQSASQVLVWLGMVCQNCTMSPLLTRGTPEKVKLLDSRLKSWVLNSVARGKRPQLGSGRCLDNHCLVQDAIEHAELLASKRRFKDVHFLHEEQGNSVSYCKRSIVVRQMFVQGFLMNRWWFRIWTLAESVLPSKWPVVYIDRHSVSLKTIVEAVYNSVHPTIERGEKKSDFPLRTFGSLLVTAEARSAIQVKFLREAYHDKGEPISIQSILLPQNGRRATDPRDMIYALYGMISDRPCPVDYSLSLVQLLAIVTKHIVAAEGNLNILTTNLEGLEEVDSFLPSWVLNLNAKRSNFSLPSPLFHSAPDRHEGRSLKVGTEMQLAVEGHRLIPISEVGPRIQKRTVSTPKNERSEKVFNFLKEIVEWHNHLQPSRGHEQNSLSSRQLVLPHSFQNDSNVTAYVQTNCCRNHKQLKRIKSFLSQLPVQPTDFSPDAGTVWSLRMIVLMRELWGLKEPLENCEIERKHVHIGVEDQALQSLWENGAAMFATTDGRLGYTNPQVRKDDEIFLVKGSKWPLLLRKKSDDLVTIQKRSMRRQSESTHDTPVLGEQSTEPEFVRPAEEAGVNDYQLVGRCYLEGVMYGEALTDDMIWEKLLLV